MTFQVSDIDDEFGSGGVGHGIPPNQGVPNARDVFRDLLGRVATLEGSPAESALQSGTGTLVNGVSAVIAATITAGSRIVVTRNGFAASTALGELMAGTRVVGAPGSFRVTSEKDDMSGVQTGDQSTFDWIVLG
jgi:hypothetical protein